MAARVACPAGQSCIGSLSAPVRSGAALRLPTPRTTFPLSHSPSLGRVSTSGRSAAAPRLPARRSTVCAAASGIVELQSMDEYESFISGSGVAVVDYYTTWCGPCKMIAPAVEEMAADIPEARFAKFNMEAIVGAAALSKEKGVKALPTFHIFRNGVLADQMSGSNGKMLRKMVSANVLAHAAVCT